MSTPVVATARHQLGDLIRAQITARELDGWFVIDDARDLGELDPAMACCIQLIRQSIRRQPSHPSKAFAETFEVWVIEPVTDPDQVEDLLDAKVEAAIEILDAIPVVKWDSADHQVHRSQRQAYKFTVHLKTQKAAS